MSKYGREWAISIMENTNSQVSSRVLSKCKTGTPDKDWVDLYLFEIAKAYQISWRPDGLLDLENIGNTDSEELGKPDTAAQGQRLQEAELSNDHLQNTNGKTTPHLDISLDAPVPASVNAIVKGQGKDEDDNDNDNDDGGNFSLPTAPSVAPTLNSVKKSTSSIPIIKPQPPPPASNEVIGTEADSDTPHDEATEAGETVNNNTFNLPTTPPFDPAQAARTVVIKTMSPKNPKTQELHSSTKSRLRLDSTEERGKDSTYDVIELKYPFRLHLLNYTQN